MNGVKQAIEALKQQRANVDTAITALEALGVAQKAPVARRAQPKRGDNMSRKGRQRQIAAMKKYWREKRKAAKGAEK
jgi:hypothetical protein